MTSEIRTNTITSRAGLSTVTFTDSGPMFSGITTFVDNSTFSVGTGGTIHAPATNTLNIGVNNTESLRIDSNSNVKIAGVCTATHFYGNGANLTGIPAQATIANNADNRVITGGSGVNLNAESNVHIDGSGRLMIGTTTEGHAAGDNLTVADSGNAGITIRSGSSNNGVLYFSDGTSGSAEYRGAVQYNHTDNYLRFYTNGDEKLRITSGGNLLIDTTVTTEATSDASDIVIGSTSDTQKGISIVGSTSGGIGNIYFTDGAGYKNQGLIQYRHADDSMRFTTNLGERVRIHSNGAVSVGGAITRNYYGALNVEKTAASTSAIDIKASGTNAQAISFGDHNTISGELLVTNSSHLSLGTSSNHPLVFYTNGSANERLRILPNSQLLHTRTDNVQRYDLEFRNTGGLGNGNYGGIHWTQGATGGTNLGAIEFEYDNSGQPDFVFKTRHGGGTAMSESVRIANDGSILTANNGTLFSWPSNPGHILYSSGEYRSTSANGTHIRCNRMNGDGHVAQWYRGQTNMVGYISITSSGTSYGSGSSDERTKKNIEVWNEDVLSKFKSLTPKKFNFNWEDDSVSKHKGYIAQNEVSNFPEAYPKNNLTDCDNEYHAFTPTDMTVYLMKGLKEAAEKIETLEQDNIALRARVTNLEDN